MGTVTKIFLQLSRRFVIAKLKECLVVLMLTFLPKLLSRGAIFRRLFWIAKKHQLPFHVSHNIMSDATLEFIRQQQADVIVTLFHQIVKNPLIKLARLGVVNLHPGLLPQFRGIQPYFWELSEDFGQAGVTLHLIEDENIDTGRLLAIASYRTWKAMSVQLNYYLTCQCASQILPRCIEKLENGTLAPQPQQQEQGSYYRWPTSSDVSRLRDQGHYLVSWKDLLGIITGRFDDFLPENVVFFEK